MEGYPIGFVIGLACGFAIGKQQKPWSEMTDTEKRIRRGLIVALAIGVVAGIVVYFQAAT